MIVLYLRAIRAYQWVKNLLVFAPVVLAHQLLDRGALFQAIYAFIAFSLIASAVYLVNDLYDLDADRKHPHKSKRPIASGSVPISMAYGLAALFSLSSLILSYYIGSYFFAVVVSYAILAFLYSAFLKKVYILDVMLLSMFYVLRIVSGALAINAEITNWLLAFSLFFFLSLSLVKRHAEVLTLKSVGESTIHGRGYIHDDYLMMLIMGPVSGLISVLILMLYIAEQAALNKYAQPIWLWGVSVLLLYWIVRIWFLANRQLIHSDPIVHALKDWPTYVVGILSLAFIYLAI